MTKRKVSKKVLDNLCEGCHSTPYCTLREILLITQRFDDRLLIQVKCIEIYKYEESQKEGKDIGWDEASIRWAKNGYAEEFAKVYDNIITPTDLYKIIKNNINSA